MKEEISKFEKDTTGELDRFFEKCKKKYFPYIKDVKINYVFRRKNKKDEEGMIVAGEAKRLSNKERDIYGYDFEICIYKKVWERSNLREKNRIAWHELNHLIVYLNQIDKKPMLDKAKRIRIGMRPHDVVIKTFEKELMIFGPEDYEIKAIKSINKYLKKKRRKLSRRRKE